MNANGKEGRDGDLEWVTKKKEGGSRDDNSESHPK